VVLMLDKRKLAPLLILPLALLLMVPPTGHASSTTFELFVSCSSSSVGTEVSSMVFLGHFVIVTCPPESGLHSSDTSFSSSAGGTYVGTGEAGGQVGSSQGSFGPTGCYTEGVVYNSAHNSWAAWRLDNAECG
jgi:hypothetical protein